MARVTFNAVIHEELDGSYWAEVEELPGCFASGFSIEELQEALIEAMQMCLPRGVNLDKPEWGPVELVDDEAPEGEDRRRQMAVCA